MVDEETIADLTPAILPAGLTAVEILRCYDLANDFLTPAHDAVSSGDLPMLSHGAS